MSLPSITPEELNMRKTFLLLVEGMDLPKHRVLNHDYRWILRNAGIRNANHLNFNALREFLKAHIEA